MSGLRTIGVVTMAALAAPVFGVYAEIGAQLVLEASALATILATITASPPTVAVAFQAVAELAAALVIAAGVVPPIVSVSVSFNASFVASASALATLAAAINAVVALAGPGLDVYVYEGTGGALGGALGAELVDGAQVEGLVLGATSSSAAAAFSWLFPGVAPAPGLVFAGTLGLGNLCSSVFGTFGSLATEYSMRAAMAAKASANLSLLPTTIAGDATLVAKAKATLQAAITIGLPDVSGKLVAAIQARVTAIGALAAQITTALGFATDGLDVFAYSGVASSLGPALTGALAGGWPDGASSSAPSTALVLVARTPAAQAALTTFFPVAA